MARKSGTSSQNIEITGGELKVEDLDKVVGGAFLGALTHGNPSPIIADQAALIGAEQHLQHDQATMAAAQAADAKAHQPELVIQHVHGLARESWVVNTTAEAAADKALAADTATFNSDIKTVITDIHQSIADHALTPIGALGHLVEMSAASPSAQPQMTAEIVNMVHAGQVSAHDAITTLASLATGQTAPATGVTASPSDLHTAVIDAMTGIVSGAHGNAQVLSDFGDALANMVTHGFSATDAITAATHGLSPSDAQTVLVEMADTGSAALRGTVANSLLNYGLENNQTFMMNHLSDGLAQALMVQNIITNHVSSSGAMAELTSLENAYLHANPSADKGQVQAISMALFDLAVHAGLAENPTGTQATAINNLLGQINTLPNLQLVLTGCGLLQVTQTSAAGLSDILNLSHQAIVDYVAANGGPDTGLQAAADKASGYINTAVTASWDFLAAHNVMFGDLKNEVVADPTNYQGYIDVFSQIMGTVVAPGPGAIISGVSKAMTAAFESDAVQHALGAKAASLIAEPFAVINAGCTFLTQAVAGVVDYGVTNIAHGAIALGNLANDLAHGNTANAAADAKALGDALLQNFTGGISLQQAETLGSDQGAMWNDIFHGDNPAGDAKQFGNDLLSTLENNPGVKAVETAFVNAFEDPGFVKVMTTLFPPPPPKVGEADEYMNTHKPIGR
jgi:hypothetical protein